MIFALPEVLGIGELALMVVAMIVLWALFFLVTALTGVLRNVPVVGGWMQDHLVEYVIPAIQEASGWAEAGIGHAIGMIFTPITWVANLFGKIGDAEQALLDGAWRIVTVTIPTAEQRAIDWAHQSITNWTGALNHRIDDFFNQTQIQFQQAQTHTDALHGQAEADIHDQALAAQAFTSDQVNGLRQAVAGDLTTIRGQIGAVPGQIAGAIGQEHTAVERDIGLAKDAAIGAAALTTATALTTALTATGVVATDLEDYLSRCGRNLCSGLNPLSTLLQALAPLVEGGLLFALVAEAARDPRAVAGELEQVVGGVVNEAATVFRDAVGLAA